MALTATEQRLLDRLIRRGDRWRDRFEVFTDLVAGELSDIFGAFVREKGNLLLSAVNALELDENGVIVNSAKNRGTILKMLRDTQQLQLDFYGPRSELRKTVGKRMNQAARRGVSKAIDTVKIAEPAMAPARGYKARASMRLVADARDMVFDALAGRNRMDLDVLRRAFIRRMIDPQGTTDSLRRDLIDSGQIETMLDSAGRRITPHERADRIAKYEFAKLSEDAHDEAIGEFYYDGDPPPLDERWYVWHTTLDGREQDTHRARHGRVLTAELWNTKDFGDGRFGAPPLRPRCRCTRTWVQPHWFGEQTQEQIFKDDGGTMPGMRKAA